jgi:HSP20 family molecular chaperone IbpA
MFDVEPTFRYDRSYKVTGGLPGMSEKEIEVAVTDDTLTLKGEKRQEKDRRRRTSIYPSVPTDRKVPARLSRSTCRV